MCDVHIYDVIYIIFINYPHFPFNGTSWVAHLPLNYIQLNYLAL